MFSGTDPRMLVTDEPERYDEVPCWAETFHEVGSEFKSPTREPAPPRAPMTLSHADHNQALAEILSDRRMSTVLARYLQHRAKENSVRIADDDVRPIVEFAIALLGDPFIDEISPEQFLDLTQALPEIPTPKFFSLAERANLYFRYKTAVDGDWHRVVSGKVVSLKRASKNTLKGRYKVGLEAFFNWAIRSRFMSGPPPDFTFVPKKNPGKRVRDAFQPEELIRLVLTPSFVGCESKARNCTPGNFLYQNGFYWSVLISLFCGLRPGEIAQLRCRDIQLLYSKPHFRFARGQSDGQDSDDEEMSGLQAKTANAFRWVPVYDLLIRLGLLERRDGIMRDYIERTIRERGGIDSLSKKDLEEIELAAEERWLFPDWKVFVRKSGVIQWGQSISKAWQYFQKTFGLTRSGLTLYSARHTFKGFLDDLSGLSERSRRVLMGHSTEENVSLQYGPKRITEEQMEIALGLNNEVIEQVSAILISAKDRAVRGELIIIESWRDDVRSNDLAFQRALAVLNGVHS